MNHLDELKKNKEIFFKFMKEKYPIVQNSNLFLRDLLYAIKNYFEKKGKRLSYTQSESLALNFAHFLEETNDFKKVGDGTWKVNLFSKKDVTKIESVINNQ